MLFFLDIDGVMIVAKGWKLPELLNDGFPAFSSKASHALQRLISKEDIIVLTTSHKSNYSIEEWKSIFKKRGITIEKLESLPVNTGNLSRKDEIVHWFANNNIKDNFIIIDDDSSLNELPDFLKEKWIQTSPHIGLTEQHAQIIASILGERLQPS